MMSKVKLGPLVEIKTGKLDANAEAADGQYPFFTCSKDNKRINRYSFDGEYVIVAGNGDLNVKYYSGKFDAYQRTYTLKPSPQLDGKFLYHFLSKYVERLREQSIGGVIKYIKLGNLTDALIPLPSLEEQKKIAAILDAADNYRQKTKALIDKYDQLTQSLFLDMFGDPVTNPMGWKFSKIENILHTKTQNGYYAPKDEYIDNGIEMVHMSDAFYRKVIPGNLKTIKADSTLISKYELRATDLLISRRSLTYEGAAQPCLIPKYDKPLLYESSLIRLRPKLNTCNTNYLFHFLNNTRARQKYVFKHVTRSTISGINNKGLNAILLYLPPITLQNQFAERVAQIEKQKQQAEASLVKAEELFSSLLQRAFKGELTS